MSRLVVLARPALTPGFQLAGVEAVAAEDAAKAGAAIERWLEAEEDILVAIDDGLLEQLSPKLLRRMESARHLMYVGIPGGGELGPEVPRQRRIAGMLHRAIGFSITFREEEIESE